MSVPIVILRPGDGARMAALEAASLDHPADAEDWEGELAQPALFGLGVEQGGELIAMVTASLTPDMADIHDVLVHPSHRRQTIASTLIKSLIRRAGERGVARLTLEVSEANQPARALYAQLGFREDGRRRKYYSDGTDAIRMSRPVSPFTGQVAPLSPSKTHEPD